MVSKIKELAQTIGTKFNDSTFTDFSNSKKFLSYKSFSTKEEIILKIGEKLVDPSLLSRVKGKIQPVSSFR